MRREPGTGSEGGHRYRPIRDSPALGTNARRAVEKGGSGSRLSGEDPAVGKNLRSFGSEPFDPFALLGVLQAHRVDFLLIGGIAGVLHGSPSMTNDLDICHSRSADNLKRLAAALVELGAKVRGGPDDVPFLLDELNLAAGQNFTFSTTAGALDCLAIPSGSQGYEELAANAVEVDLDGLVVQVVGLNDLIRMKRAAGRPKDLVELEILGALRDEIGGE